MCVAAVAGSGCQVTGSVSVPLSACSAVTVAGRPGVEPSWLRTSTGLTATSALPCWSLENSVVLAGTREGVARAGETAIANGARRVIPVKVDGPFHTPLMAPAAEALADTLEATAFMPPVAPVVSNADARPYVDSVAWAPRLAWHLVRPVLWRQSLETLAGLGVNRFVEVGPGGVLTGLARRTAPDATVETVAGPEDVAHLAGAAA